MVRQNKKAQYKIQQMAFLILAIFFFFVLVGLFFVGWQFANLQKNVLKLEEEKALSTLKVISDSIELHCDSSDNFCIDKDKLTAFTEMSDLYSDFWAVASIELLIVHPKRSFTDDPILCPQANCDYYVLYDSGQVNKQTFSAYVTVCEQIDRSHEICELAKLIVGVDLREDVIQ